MNSEAQYYARRALANMRVAMSFLRAAQEDRARLVFREASHNLLFLDHALAVGVAKDSLDAEVLET